jgi:hypothetical protein
MKQIILFSLIFVLGACSHKQKNRESIYINDNVPTRIYDIEPQSNNKILLSEISNRIKYIPLETTDDILIGSIDKLEVKDSLFFFLDRQSQIIWCFDQNGKYKYKIDKRGQGPGEYIRIFDFNIDNKNNQILILDRDTRKILFYNLNGEYITDLKMDITATRFSVLTDNFLFYTSGRDIHMGKSKDEFGYNFFLVNKKGQITSKYFPYNELTDNSMEDKIFENHQNSAFVHYATNDIIYEFNDSGDIINKIVFDFGKYKIPAKTSTNDKNNPHYAHIFQVFYSEIFMYVVYIYEMRLRFILHDNKTGKQINGSMLENDMDYIPFLNPAPMKVIENKLLFVKEAGDIFKQEKDKKKIYEDIEQLSSLKEDDNPVIAIIYLNLQ